MMQLAVIALGGAVGSLLRYLLSNGVYSWLGRSFPFGTLSVNLIGSLLMGLMAEVLILQRVVLSLEYRAAILVGVFGGFTTFSSFALDTFYLLEQGQINKAAVNVGSNVLGCLLAVWLGMLVGRGLFAFGQGNVYWFGWPFPYALTVINGIGALLLGLLIALLSDKLALDIEYRTVLAIVLMGSFMTLSGLYLALALLESNYDFVSHLSAILTVILVNIAVCGLGFWSGLWLARQL